MLAPLLFNICTNDQPRSEGTRLFIYADDPALAAQDREFGIVEERLSNALDGLTPYYKENHLHAPTCKSIKDTSVCLPPTE